MPDQKNPVPKKNPFVVDPDRLEQLSRRKPRNDVGEKANPFVLSDAAIDQVEKKNGGTNGFSQSSINHTNTGEPIPAKDRLDSFFETYKAITNNPLAGLYAPLEGNYHPVKREQELKEKGRPKGIEQFIQPDKPSSDVSVTPQNIIQNQINKAALESKKEFEDFVNNPNTKTLEKLTGDALTGKEKETKAQLSNRFYQGGITAEDVSYLVDKNPFLKVAQTNGTLENNEAVAKKINDKTKNIAEASRIINKDAYNYAFNREELDRLSQRTEIEIANAERTFGSVMYVNPSTTSLKPIKVVDGLALVNRDEYINEQRQKLTDLSRRKDFLEKDFSKNVYEPRLAKISSDVIREIENALGADAENLSTDILLPEVERIVKEKKDPILMAQKGTVNAGLEITGGRLQLEAFFASQGEDAENFVVVQDKDGRTRVFRNDDYLDVLKEVSFYFNIEKPAKKKLNAATDEFLSKEGNEKFTPLLKNREEIAEYFSGLNLDNLEAEIRAEADTKQSYVNNTWQEKIKRLPEYKDLERQVQGKIQAGMSEQEAVMWMNEQIMKLATFNPINQEREKNVLDIVKEANRKRMSFILDGLKKIDKRLSIDGNGNVVVEGATQEEVKNLDAVIQENYQKAITEVIDETEKRDAEVANAAVDVLVNKFGSTATAFGFGAGTFVNKLMEGFARYYNLKDLRNYYTALNADDLVSQSEFVKNKSTFQGFESLLDPAYYAYQMGNTVVSMAPAVVATAATGGVGGGLVASGLELFQSGLMTYNDLITTGRNANGLPITEYEASRAMASNMRNNFIPTTMLSILQFGSIARALKPAVTTTLKTSLGKELTGAAGAFIGGTVPDAIQETLQSYVEGKAFDEAVGKDGQDFFDYLSTDEALQSAMAGFAGSLGFAAPGVLNRLGSIPGNIKNWKEIAKNARAEYAEFNTDILRGNAIEAEMQGMGMQFRDGIRLRLFTDAFVDDNMSNEERLMLENTLKYSVSLDKAAKQLNVAPSDVNGMAAAHYLALSENMQTLAEANANTALGKIYSQRQKEYENAAAAVMSGDVSQVNYIKTQNGTPVFLNKLDAQALAESGDLQGMVESGEVTETNIKYQKKETDADELKRLDMERAELAANQPTSNKPPNVPAELTVQEEEVAEVDIDNLRSVFIDAVKNVESDNPVVNNVKAQVEEDESNVLTLIYQQSTDKESYDDAVRMFGQELVDAAIAYGDALGVPKTESLKLPDEEDVINFDEEEDFDFDFDENEGVSITDESVQEESVEMTDEEIRLDEVQEREALLQGKAAQDREKGFFVENGVRYDRNEKDEGVKGERGEVRFTNDVAVPFTYKLVEADRLQPSHQDGRRNKLHFLPEAQPKPRTDKGSIAAEDSFANEPRFNELGEHTNAYGGAPVVNDRDEVIQGNNRTAGLRKGYKSGNEQYKNDLIENAEQFGFTKEQVRSMKNPILVREVNTSDEGAIELGNYDVKDLETGGKRSMDPIAVSRRMPLSVKSRLVSTLFSGDDKTLNQAIRDNENTVLELLSPYLNQAQRNTLFADGGLTEMGIKDVEALVQQFLFDGGDVALPELFEGLTATQREGIKKSLPYILGVPIDKSILPEIQNAILVLNDFINRRVDSFDGWLRLRDMFNDGKTPLDIYTPLEIEIARQLHNAKTQKAVREIFSKYAAEANGRPADMFNQAVEGKPKTEAVNAAFNIENYDTTRKTDTGSQKTADRKSDREAASETTKSEEKAEEKSALAKSEQPSTPVEEAKPSVPKEVALLQKKSKEAIAYKGKLLADKIRRLKSPRNIAQANIFGVPMAIYDGALEIVATAVENGSKLADAIANGIRYIRDNFGEEFDEKGFRESLEDVEVSGFFDTPAENEIFNEVENFGLILHDDKSVIQDVRQTHAKRSPEMVDANIDYVRQKVNMTSTQIAMGDIIRKAIDSLGIDKAAQVFFTALRDPSLPLSTKGFLNTELRLALAGRKDLLFKLSRIDVGLDGLSSQASQALASRRDWRKRPPDGVEQMKVKPLLEGVPEAQTLFDVDAKLQETLSDTNIPNQIVEQQVNKTEQSANEGVQQQEAVNAEVKKKAESRRMARKKAAEKLTSEQKNFYKLKAEAAQNNISGGLKTRLEYVLKEIREAAKKC